MARIPWSPESGRAPKKSMTPYLYFVKTRKNDIAAANPGLTFGELMQKVAEYWR